MDCVLACELKGHPLALRMALRNDSLVCIEMHLWLETRLMYQAVLIKQEPIALSKKRGQKGRYHERKRRGLELFEPCAGVVSYGSLEAWRPRCSNL